MGFIFKPLGPPSLRKFHELCVLCIVCNSRAIFNRRQCFFAKSRFLSYTLPLSRHICRLPALLILPGTSLRPYEISCASECEGCNCEMIKHARRLLWRILQTSFPSMRSCSLSTSRSAARRQHRSKPRTAHHSKVIYILAMAEHIGMTLYSTGPCAYAKCKQLLSH